MSAAGKVEDRIFLLRDLAGILNQLDPEQRGLGAYASQSAYALNEITCGSVVICDGIDMKVTKIDTSARPVFSIELQPA